MDSRSNFSQGKNKQRERRLSEPPIQQSKVLDNLLQASPIPTFMIDNDHRIIYWNRALEELSGIPASQVIGTRQHWRAFYADKRPCMADLLVAEAYEGIERWYAGKFKKSNLVHEAYEALDFFPALNRNGRWIRFTAAAVRDSDGNLIGAVETLEDISERRNAEQALIESERKLQSVIQGFPIAAFLIDREHRVTHWNLALQELSGIAAEQVLGTNQHWRAFYKEERPCLSDLILDQNWEQIEKWYAGKANKSQLLDEAFEATDFFADLGDSGKWLRFTAAAIRNSQGAVIGAVQTLEDITARIKAEQDLLAANDQLEIRVEERTRELIESSRALKAEVIERSNAEQLLKRKERELKIKSANLEKVNTALKVLLKQRENDKKELEDKILMNVKEVLIPYVKKLERTRLDEHQRAALKEIETNLNDIISPFVKSLTARYLNLTPREIQISALVREGKTSKEISELLNTSTAAIDFHRNNIRVKLGLKYKKTNLRTHLLTYQES